MGLNGKERGGGSVVGEAERPRVLFGVCFLQLHEDLKAWMFSVFGAV